MLNREAQPPRESKASDNAEANEEERKAKKRAYHRAYYEANKEKCKEQNKAYYAANKEKYAANKEKHKAKCKAYYEANKEKIKARRERKKNLNLGIDDQNERVPKKSKTDLNQAAITFSIGELPNIQEERTMEEDFNQITVTKDNPISPKKSDVITQESEVTDSEEGIEEIENQATQILANTTKNKKPSALNRNTIFAQPQQLQDFSSTEEGKGIRSKMNLNKIVN